MDILTHLRIFIDIADHGSLAAAARVRSLAPSAVTASLRRLEAHLGTQLIQRSTRNLTFTPEGVLFLEQCRRIVRDLDDTCDQISIDDFGTGYSSLLYLKRLPIDRCFVNDLAYGAEDAAIVSSIIGLGQTLDLQVVTEGVETDEQRELLTNLGYDALLNPGRASDDKSAPQGEMEMV